MAQCGAFVFVGVSVDKCQSEDSFVCFGVKPAQRACARDFLRDRKKTRKGKVPEQSKVGEGQLLSEELGPVEPEAGSMSARG